MANDNGPDLSKIKVLNIQQNTENLRTTTIKEWAHSMRELYNALIAEKFTPRQTIRIMFSFMVAQSIANWIK